MENQKKNPNAANTENPTSGKPLFALGKQNYLFIAISFILIVAGFALMMGGGTTDSTYNPDIFSTRRIVIAPAIAFTGFVCMIFAILKKPKQ